MPSSTKAPACLGAAVETTDEHCLAAILYRVEPRDTSHSVHLIDGILLAAIYNGVALESGFAWWVICCRDGLLVSLACKQNDVLSL